MIASLLASWEDLVDPQQSRGAFGDDSSVGFGLMPASYSSSVREVERLLRALKVEDRALWWQLHQRFFRVVRTQRIVWFWSRNAHGKRVRGWRWGMVLSWDSRVVTHEPRLRCGGCEVCRGVRWLAINWGAGFEPMLPEGLAIASKL